jgi:hypothetical protein
MNYNVTALPSGGAKADTRHFIALIKLTACGWGATGLAGRRGRRYAYGKGVDYIVIVYTCMYVTGRI